MEQKVRSSICYCDIPREKLAYLIQEHFIHHIPTTELMERVSTPREKEEVAVVALLDVPREDLIPLLSLEAPQKLPHWLDCHEYIRKELAGEGLYLKGIKPPGP